MDRHRPTNGFPDLIAAAASEPTPATVLLSVCTTCKTADGEAGVGEALFDAVTAMTAADSAVTVRRVQCLGVCKRPATVAVSSADGYTFLFGDLPIDQGAAALASFVQAYRAADYGLVPWRQRAEVLRKGLIARLPPPRWSPDDGRAPT